MMLVEILPNDFAVPLLFNLTWVRGGSRRPLPTNTAAAYFGVIIVKVSKVSPLFPLPLC
jgi:hypothetical protein